MRRLGLLGSYPDAISTCLERPLLVSHETWSCVLSWPPLPPMPASLPQIALTAGGPDHTVSLLVETPPRSCSLMLKPVCMVLMACMCSTLQARARSLCPGHCSLPGFLCVPSPDPWFTVRGLGRSDSSCT